MDNGDGRKLLITDAVTLAQNLFEQTFDLRSLLIESHVAMVVTGALVGFPCVGILPKVTVDIQRVALPDFNRQCLSPSVNNTIKQWF